MRATTDVAAIEVTSKYQARNPQALKHLRAGNTQFKIFPKPVVDAGFKAAQEVYAEYCDKSPEFKKVFDDMRAFQKEQILWNRYLAVGRMVGHISFLSPSSIQNKFRRNYVETNGLYEINGRRRYWP